MRRLQPTGRLTGETVWRACFGENLPKAAGTLGSPTFVTAFFNRMEALTKDLATKLGADDKKDATLLGLLGSDPMVSTGLFNGASFTSVIRKGIHDSTFVPDVVRDTVSTPPLYAAQDAAVKTEKDLEHALMIDFRRNFPVITATCGNVVETADFRPFKGQKLSDEQNQENVRGFVAQMDRVFGGEITHAQRNVMLIGFTQAGFTPFTALIGVGGEHMQAKVDVRREADGSIVMTYATMPNCPIEAQYSYCIERDGTNYCVGDFVSRVRPQPVNEG